MKAALLSLALVLGFCSYANEPVALKPIKPPVIQYENGVGG